MTILKNKLIYNLLYRGLCESLQTKDISSNVALGVYDTSKVPDSIKNEVKNISKEKTIEDTDSIVLVKLLVDPDTSDDPKKITEDKLHDIISRCLYQDKSDVEVVTITLNNSKFLVAKIKYADESEEKTQDKVDDTATDDQATEN